MTVSSGDKVERLQIKGKIKSGAIVVGLLALVCLKQTEVVTGGATIGAGGHVPHF